MTLTTPWKLIQQTAYEWGEDRVSRLAASLTYYAIFSLAPLLLIAIAIVGFIFGPAAAHHEVKQQVRQLVGEPAAGVVQTMLANAGRHRSGVAATIIALILLLYGATNVFAELQDAINGIWDVKRGPESGIWATIRSRFWSFVLVLGIAFLLLISVVVSALLAGLSDWLGGGADTVRLINNVGSLALFALLFAMIFKFLPDVRVLWRDVWIGALLTAVLFAAGKYLIGLYLGRSTVTSVYGAAGSLVVLLIWMYYSAQILYIGAEFTQVYARFRGDRIDQDRPAPGQTVPQPATAVAVPTGGGASAGTSPRPTGAPGPVTAPGRGQPWTVGGAMMLAGFVAGQLLRAHHDQAAGAAARTRRLARPSEPVGRQARMLLSPKERQRVEVLEQRWKDATQGSYRDRAGHKAE